MGERVLKLVSLETMSIVKDLLNKQTKINIINIFKFKYVYGKKQVIKYRIRLFHRNCSKRKILKTISKEVCGW